MRSSHSPEKAQELFRACPQKWWVAGGWAIDLFLGTQTREHEDLDIAILRRDQQVFRSHLRDWELWPGLGQGELENEPIKLGEELPVDREVLWCRPSENAEWAFELLLNKSESAEWVFKRNKKIRKSIKDLNLSTENGVPYLNPEIVLLFKAKNMFDKDQHDFEQVAPKLSLGAKKWLGESLRIVHPTHPWIREL